MGRNHETSRSKSSGPGGGRSIRYHPVSSSHIEDGEAASFEEDDDDDEQQQQLDEIQTSSSRDELLGVEWRWLMKPLLPDDCFAPWGVRLLDGPTAVKLAKFVLVTFLGIVSMFALVRSVGWEHDRHLTIGNIWTYEGNLIVMDATLFFVVGRLYQQRGVDHVAWLLVVLLANLYSSGIASIQFLQHAFTLYEMHCLWPFSLWLFVAVATVLVIGVILLHVQRAVAEGVFVQKLVEMGICVGLFLIPPLSSPYFHFHHWFAGWLVGMHTNFDVWWSRAVMAWCWGCYINGIAVYGRDPILTCGYSMYLSASLGCPYLECYLEGIRHPDANHTVKPMIAPDWRNCSADTYHS